jgi:hypothetical protein
MILGVVEAPSHLVKINLPLGTLPRIRNLLQVINIFKVSGSFNLYSTSTWKHDYATRILAFVNVLGVYFITLLSMCKAQSVILELSMLKLYNEYPCG